MDKGSFFTSKPKDLQVLEPKSKTGLFVNQYLDKDGRSQIISRYDLPKPFAYTSGDGIFRSDGTLGKKYKMFRFSPTLHFDNKSNCWILTDKEKEDIKKIHSELVFPSKGEEKYKGAGRVVYYIKFFGKGEEIFDKGISTKIKKEIANSVNGCVNCGTRSNIECDHKNSLKNDERVLKLDTQILDDFQPLCKHCNDVKREHEKNAKREGKRFGATKLGFPVDFLSGDETLNLEDPNWYKGTYWGDCLAFKKELYRK